MFPNPSPFEYLAVFAILFLAGILFSLLITKSFPFRKGSVYVVE